MLIMLINKTGLQILYYLTTIMGGNRDDKLMFFSVLLCFCFFLSTILHGQSEWTRTKNAFGTHVQQRIRYKMLFGDHHGGLHNICLWLIPTYQWYIVPGLVMAGAKSRHACFVEVQCDDSIWIYRNRLFPLCTALNWHALRAESNTRITVITFCFIIESSYKPLNVCVKC